MTTMSGAMHRYMLTHPTWVVGEHYKDGTVLSWIGDGVVARIDGDQMTYMWRLMAEDAMPFRIKAFWKDEFTGDWFLVKEIDQ